MSMLKNKTVLSLYSNCVLFALPLVSKISLLYDLEMLSMKVFKLHSYLELILIPVSGMCLFIFMHACKMQYETNLSVNKQ